MLTLSFLFYYYYLNTLFVFLVLEIKLHIGNVRWHVQVQIYIYIKFILCTKLSRSNKIEIKSRWMDGWIYIYIYIVYPFLWGVANSILNHICKLKENNSGFCTTLIRKNNNIIWLSFYNDDVMKGPCNEIIPTNSIGCLVMQWDYLSYLMTS